MIVSLILQIIYSGGIIGIDQTLSTFNPNNDSDNPFHFRVSITLNGPRSEIVSELNIDSSNVESQIRILNVDKQADSLELSYLQLMTHNPITIDGNLDFQTQAVSEGWDLAVQEEYS